jgi:ParB family chromosome partitioning protein
MKKKGLGRGLGALIKDDPVGQPGAPGNAPQKVSPDRIRANRWQPRHSFDEEALAELAASVREHGVLQPLLVRPLEDGYELIAGERRLRAARDAGLEEVPIILTEAGDVESLEIALIENLQREDLNVIDEAEGYRTLADQFELTQEQIAKRVGKGRATVANALRILSLPEDIRGMVADGTLSAGHAKALLALEIPAEQQGFAKLAANEGFSVRELERRVDKAKRAPRKPRVSRSDIPVDHLTYLSDRLHSLFGTSVRIQPSKTYANGKKGKGAIEIDFYSNEELDRILEVLGLTED